MSPTGHLDNSLDLLPLLELSQAGEAVMKHGFGPQ